MKKHMHSFRQWGGGTLLIGHKEFPSDADYHCKCGKWFVINATTERYFSLPLAYRYKPKNSKTMKVTELRNKEEY